MLDTIAMTSLIAMFLLSLLYVAACDRLTGKRQ